MGYVHRLFYIAVGSSLAFGPATAEENLSRLPDPIRAYAEGFAPHCKVRGRSRVIVNEMYSGDLFGKPDINHDGLPDYFAYKCMFGCDDLPFAFVGLGIPCQFGVLLLSSGNGYLTVSLPGTITRLNEGPPTRIAVSRECIHPEDRGTGTSCRYLFELREGRFQIVRPCPNDGCQAVMSLN